MERKLAALCLVTDDVPRMRRFYESILQVAGEGDDRHCSFVVGAFQLNIFTAVGMEEMAPGSTLGSGTGRSVLEVEVEDVDAEYARLGALGVGFVKLPATYPWGLRSVWFRDPDGNVVDFFAQAAS